MPDERAPEEERLQKVLARAGFGSRRAAEELIRAGRVAVSGRPARLGDRVRPGRDQVTVDRVPIPADPRLRYLALNKPAGVTTTMKDAHAARTLTSFLPQGPRVFAVGRLDRDTEGLLLLTNDGALAHRIQHPSGRVEKEYLVEVDGSISVDAVRRLRAGVDLDDGPGRPRPQGRGGRVRGPGGERIRGRSSVRVVMAEGRKRLVRRMFAQLGYPVRRLVRVRVGPVALGRLRPGEARPLDADEVMGLYRLTGLRRAAPGRASTRGRP
jgi:23S rRNA pseudouridine2605 synthase